MKIKLINPSSNLPNCWKQCGVNKEDWDKLQAGGEIEVRSTVVGMKHLVEEVSSPIKKDKGGK